MFSQAESNWINNIHQKRLMKYQTSWEPCFKTKATRFIWEKKKKLSQDKILGVTTPKSLKFLHRFLHCTWVRTIILSAADKSPYVLVSVHLPSLILYTLSLYSAPASRASFIGPWTHQVFSNTQSCLSTTNFVQMLLSVLLHSPHHSCPDCHEVNS